MASLREEALGHALRRKDAGREAAEAMFARSTNRAQAILRDMNPVQRAFALDPGPRVAGLCPRRAGKSYAGCGTALALGEAKPGSVVLLISLNLKMTKRNYWLGSSSGLHMFNRKYGLGLEFNTTDLRWEHENGSIGYLLGCDTDESLENMRGMEADLYLIDECKSFAPQVLHTLIDDVIAPQRISRDGRIAMIGTPGSVLSGPFYEATNPQALDEKGRPYCVVAGQTDPFGRSKRVLWSLHKWTMQDNEKMPDQWAGALETKEMRGWADDHPSWRREYLGEWVQSSDGLVFGYSDAKQADRNAVTWVPAPGTTDNPAGLPMDKGPWRFVWGLDLGFNDPTALVVAAYSTTHRLLRQVVSHKAPHMLLDDIEQLLSDTAKTYGMPDRIFADTGGLGKLLIETLRARGWNIEPAKKADKNDAIELVNADFRAGRIQIIEGSDLEHQLQTVAWDTESGSRDELAKTGRLREDKRIPNDVTDAFLYLHRGCHHLFSVSAVSSGPIVGSIEWWNAKEKESIEKAKREVRAQAIDGMADRLPRGPGIADMLRRKAPRRYGRPR